MRDNQIALYQLRRNKRQMQYGYFLHSNPISYYCISMYLLPVFHVSREVFLQIKEFFRFSKERK